MSTTLDARTDAEPRPIVRERSVPLYWVILRVLGSLQLTVVLFTLAMVLVFFGTLAQIDKSNVTVVNEYFRSWYVWVPYQLLAEFDKTFFHLTEYRVWNGSFPFPGGWLLGGIMLANLFAAHLTRFKLSWRRSGIITIHFGVILLMVGELVTGLYSVESRMALQLGESASFIDNSLRVELAFHDAASGRTITIPQGMLRPGATVTHPDLPLDVEVLEYHKNTDLQTANGGDDLALVISKASGGRYEVVSAPEVSGTNPDQHENVPAVRVRLKRKGTDEVILERLFSMWEYRNGPALRVFVSIPPVVTADDHSYTVQLRNKRIAKPYTITLLNFEHTNYAGTTEARRFVSTIRLVDPETHDEREVRISMNHPLRHRGETFYQSGTISEDRKDPSKDSGTVLQVMRNPGWRLPYLSCFVVTLGMLIHFGMSLLKFTNRRTG